MSIVMGMGSWNGEMLMRISLACDCTVALFLMGRGDSGPIPKALSNGGGLQDSANASPKSEAKADSPHASTVNAIPPCQVYDRLTRHHYLADALGTLHDKTPESLT